MCSADYEPPPLPPPPIGHRFRVDPELCGRAFGQGLCRRGDLFGDLPRGAAVWRVLVGRPAAEIDLSSEGIALLAPDGASYSPAQARQMVDELVGRISGHRSWLATWTRYAGRWARRFALGVEAGWLREVGESERDETGRSDPAKPRVAEVIIEHLGKVHDDDLACFLLSEEER